MADINTKIGERIKNIRLQKMMTQKELCGTVITRNMLSCIENGSANPSVKTLEYIAERLNVPAGLLISGEEGGFELKKLAKIDAIRRAFNDGAYSICADLCCELEDSDDEINMILSKTYLMMAREAFDSGKLRSMCGYLDDAVSYSEKTVYKDEAVLSVASCYFRFIRKISATLTSEFVSEGRTWESDITAIGDEFCRYSFMLDRTEQSGGEYDFVPSLTLFSDKSYEKHIMAVDLMSKERYAEALTLFKELIYGTSFFGLPILYIILRQAETCARYTDDYKSAYEFSNSCISVLDNLLK